MNKTVWNNEEILKKLEKYYDFYYINEIYYRVLENSDRANPNAISEPILFKLYIQLLISILFSMILLVINLPSKLAIINNKQIALTRVDRSRYKIQNICGEEVQYITDDIKNYDFSIYKCGTRRSRVKLILFQLSINSFIDFNNIIRIVELSEIIILLNTLYLSVII